MISRFGYLIALVYLVYCGLAIYSLKGIVWLLVSLAGPIAFFPIWGYFLLGYSEPGVWIMFVYLVIDAITNAKRMKKTSSNNEQSEYSSDVKFTDKSINPEIIKLETKLNELSELEKIEKLKEELNQKRIDRGLISLSEYEQLDQDIKNKREVYKSYKNEYLELIDEKKNAKTERIVGTLVLGPFSIFMINSGFNQSWILIFFGVLFGIILIFNFSNKSKYMNWADAEIGRLSIEKDSQLEELKELKKIYKNQTI